MPNNQKGFAPLLIIGIVLLGLISTVYLVINGQNFFPSAQQDGSDIYRGQGQMSFGFSSGYPNIKYPPILPTTQYTNEETSSNASDDAGGQSNYNDSPDIQELPSEKATEGQSTYYEPYMPGIPTEKQPYITYSPKQEFPVQVVVRSDFYATNRFDAKVSYPSDLLEIVRIEPEMKDLNQICTQVEVEACTYENVLCGKAPCPPQKICQKFGNSCMVPDGWKIQPTPNNCVADMKITLKDQDYASDSIIVGFKDGVNDEQINNLIYGNGLKHTKFNSINATVVRLPDTSAIDWICKLKASDIVSYVEPNFIVSISDGYTTNDSSADRMTTSETSANTTSSNGGTSSDSSTQNNGGQYTEERIKRRMVPKTLITKWTSQKYDNTSGTLHLSGESKGLLTIYKQNPVRMATIIFRAKKEGKGMLTFNDDSAMYRRGDNTNVLQQKGTLAIAIRTVDNGGGGMCERYIAPCNPNQKTVYDQNSSPNCPSFKCIDEKTPVVCPLAQPNCGPNEQLEDMRNVMDTGHWSAYPQCPLFRCIPKPNNCEVAPECKDGESLTITGTENGCTKYSCFKAQGRVCDKPLPSCPNNQAVVTSIDDKDGCRSYSCVYPPMLRCDTSIPVCAEGQTLINNGNDSTSCGSYSCVYIDNPQTSKCDPSKSIVHGNPESGEGRILCESIDAEGNSQTISYSFSDFNKDGKTDFGDVTFFFSPSYWQ